jgi:tRNA A-37 threonylcarbamoyl transferase component Bud32
MTIQTHKTGKWSWKFASGAEEFLQYLLKRWETIEDLPGAEVLKSNLSRTVIAFPSTSSRPALIIKRYHVRGLKERLKYVLLLSRAASEWTALKHLRTTEVAVPRPLAFGEKRSGRILFSAGLIMERLPNARGVSQWLREKRVGDPVRLEVLRQVGYQVAKLHGAGCRHSDLHAGNILIREGGLEDKPQVVLIDHHVCRIGAMPSERQKRNNLAKLFHSFLPIIKHSEALELLRAYKEACGAPKWKASTLQRVLDDLVHRAHHLEAVRLRSRLKRCWKNSSQFARTVSRGWRVYRRREVPIDSLHVFQEGRINLESISEDQSGLDIGGATIELEKGAQPVVVKQYNYRGLWRRIWHRVYPSPLHKEWEVARELEVRGIPNPKALALMVQYHFGLPGRVILIVERTVKEGL